MSSVSQSRSGPLQAGYKMRGKRSCSTGSANVVPKSAWKSSRGKWDWRSFLTEEEAAIVAEYDDAREAIKRLQVEKAFIQNRAIQRAKLTAARNA